MQRQPLLVSVPWQRRLMHVGLHAAFVAVEVGVLLAITLAVVIADLATAQTAWTLSLSYGAWLVVLTSALCVPLTRFASAPYVIVGVHLLAVPGLIVVYLVLNAELVLRLLQGS